MGLLEVKKSDQSIQTISNGSVFRASKDNISKKIKGEREVGIILLYYIMFLYYIFILFIIKMNGFKKILNSIDGMGRELSSTLKGNSLPLSEESSHC